LLQESLNVFLGIPSLKHSNYNFPSWINNNALCVCVCVCLPMCVGSFSSRNSGVYIPVSPLCFLFHRIFGEI